MRFLTSVIMLSAILVVYAQDTAEHRRFIGPEETFEVASIKPNRSGTEEERFNAPPGRVVATNVTLQHLVQYGYSIFGSDSDGRIVAPAWIKTARFDVDARTPSDTSPERTMSMLRQLLAARFGLKVHYETQTRPAYTLVIARADKRLGPELKASSIDCASYRAAAEASQARGVAPQGDQAHPVCAQRFEPGHFVASGLTMEQLAAVLSGLGRPVIDQTGLGNQQFDIEMRWTPVTRAADGSTSGASIFTALEEQLGLKLTPAERAIDVLVVDHIEQPTDN